MILSSIFNYGSIEDPSTPLGDVDWGGSAHGGEAKSGVPISRNAAFKLSAFWKGVNLRSNYIARLPLDVKRTTARGKEVDTKHPAYELLKYQPNSEQNAFTLKKTAEVHQIVSGNGYIFVRRLGSGDPFELLNLDPDNTWPVRENGKLWYVTRIDMGDNHFVWRKHAPEDVIHLKGLGWDGLCGYPFMRVARDTLGLGLAANEYASRFFRNNAEPRVIVTVPGTMPPEAQEQFAKQWNAMHQGLENSHRTAIITNGGKIEGFSIKASDAQLLEQRKFTLIEIANLLDLQPHKVGSSERVAYNSLEQENQAFADDTLEPRLTEWEQELRNKILTEKEKKTESHVIKFDRNELVKADLTDRAAYLEKAIKGPWMTIDEGRASEGLNPLPGEDGDHLLLPEPPKPPAAPPENPEPEETDDEPEETPKTTKSGPKNAHHDLLVRTCSRLAKRVTAQASTKAKNWQGFCEWIDGRGVESHRPGVLDELEAMLPAFEEVGVPFVVSELASRIIDGAHRDLQGISTSVSANGLLGAVDEWAKRFSGQAMEGVVSEVFARGKAA